ncbi:MAG TPA: hypothetical protein VF250_09710 [Conexibacter sp.]
MLIAVTVSVLDAVLVVDAFIGFVMLLGLLASRIAAGRDFTLKASLLPPAISIDVRTPPALDPPDDRA